MQVVETETGKPVRRPVEVRVPGVVDRIVPSPDGSSAILIAGKPRARVIALSNGARIGRVKHVRAVHDAAYAPSGRVVVSGGIDRAAILWDARTWTETRRLQGHVGQILAVAFDRSGSRVAASSTDQTARVWFAPTGFPIAALYGHTGFVSDVAFGPGRSARHRKRRRNGPDVAWERPARASAPRSQGCGAGSGLRRAGTRSSRRARTGPFGFGIPERRSS